MTSNLANYGNCFTFNSYNNEADDLGGLRVSSLTGPSFGLSIVLNLDQLNYMTGGQSKQGGARMVVHDTKLNPLVDEYGQDLAPNSLTHVSVQETNLTRQPAPYTSKCISEWAQTAYPEMIDYEVPYSLAVSPFKVC